jgi:hypothetical protein
MEIDNSTISTLTDDQLFKALKSHGLPAGPITGTTRTIYEKRLRNYLENNSTLTKEKPATKSASRAPVVVENLSSTTIIERTLIESTNSKSQAKSNKPPQTAPPPPPPTININISHVHHTNPNQPSMSQSESQLNTKPKSTTEKPTVKSSTNVYESRPTIQQKQEVEQITGTFSQSARVLSKPTMTDMTAKSTVSSVTSSLQRSDSIKNSYVSSNQSERLEQFTARPNRQESALIPRAEQQKQENEQITDTFSQSARVLSKPTDMTAKSTAPSVTSSLQRSDSIKNSYVSSNQSERLEQFTVRSNRQESTLIPRASVNENQNVWPASHQLTNDRRNQTERLSENKVTGMQTQTTYRSSVENNLVENLNTQNSYKNYEVNTSSRSRYETPSAHVLAASNRETMPVLVPNKYSVPVINHRLSPLVKDKYAERLQNYGLLDSNTLPKVTTTSTNAIYSLTPGTIRSRPAMYTPKPRETQETMSQATIPSLSDKNVTPSAEPNAKKEFINLKYALAIVLATVVIYWMIVSFHILN